MTRSRRPARVPFLLAAALAFVPLACVAADNAGPTLSATDASDHIGQRATVCGAVVSVKYAKSTRGEPTFLNLDEPYPAHVFTVVIWGSNRAAFGRPEVTYAHKNVCVTGMIQSYRGKPEIMASRPDQIEVKR